MINLIAKHDFLPMVKKRICCNPRPQKLTHKYFLENQAGQKPHTHRGYMMVSITDTTHPDPTR